MILYHVTLELRQSPYFLPRVPENAEDYDENDTIPRICFSNTIEGCLSSIPEGGWGLDEALRQREQDVIKIFRLDTVKYGVRNENIVTPYQLHKQKLVRDAWRNGEYWVLEPIHFLEGDIRYYRVLNFAYRKIPVGRDILYPSQSKTHKPIITDLKLQRLQ